jgi:hypothetical protein
VTSRSGSSSPAIPLCFWNVCAWFDDDQIVERAEAGELSAQIRRDKVVSRPWLQPGARSQIVRYLDGTGTLLAIAYRYLQPDGSIGASGHHDPTWLRHQGQVYVPAHKDAETCSDCPQWRARLTRETPGDRCPSEPGDLREPGYYEADWSEEAEAGAIARAVARAV